MAGFIGTSNLLTGSVTRLESGCAVIQLSPEERIIVPVPSPGPEPGTPVELTVRPEKIELATDRPAAGGCVLRGTVTEVVYLGTSTNYAVTTTTGADIVVFQQNTAAANDAAARGDSVWLSWQPEHSYPIG